MDAVAEWVLFLIPPTVLIALSMINAVAFVFRWWKEIAYVDREVLLVLALACFSYGLSYLVVIYIEQPLIRELQAVLRLSYAVMLAGLSLANYSAAIKYYRDTKSKWDKNYSLRQQLRSAWRRFRFRQYRHFESRVKTGTTSHRD